MYLRMKYCKPVLYMLRKRPFISLKTFFCLPFQFMYFYIHLLIYCKCDLYFSFVTDVMLFKLLQFHMCLQIQIT